MGYILLVPILIFAFFILLMFIFIVKQQTAAVVERLGKFHSIRNSGLQFKIPVIDRIAGRINLKIQQLDVIVETKTKDDVFVRLKISVQFQVIKDKVYDAFYKLESPHDQITSYVFDVVRAEVPKMKLDDVFERKDDIAIAVKSELNDAMIDYGYDIIKTLVTDIDPDAQVKAAMNRINASEREKIAARFEGDAARILIVEKAKAEVTLAETHLGFTKIKAPFNGIMDHLHVREGSMLEEGELLTTLSDNSEMWVYFNVPEAEYLDYAMNATKSRKEEVQLLMANNKKFNQKGFIETSAKTHFGRCQWQVQVEEIPTNTI